jgi:mRNA-degrading endonuclease toxin of MazEF toxin-antitoxin module
LPIEDLHPDFGRTSLKRSSVIKLDKLVTVEITILLGELGELSEALLREVDEKLRYALEL